MGIELQITSSAADGEITTSKKQLNESDITIGCYNDDTVKLESRMLQGSHVRVSSEWNSDTNEQRLIITNISGNTSIFLDKEALESDEYREISEATEVRLGHYTLTIRDTSLNYFATPANAKSDFALENFSPSEFSLDTAMQSILKPNELLQTSSESPIIEAKPKPILPTTQATNQTPKEPQLTMAKSEQSVNTTHSDVVTTEIPTLQLAKHTTKNTDSSQPENLSHNPVQTDKDLNIMVSSTEKQTLFEGVVGTEDILDLNFNAYRLYAISGRIIHHNQPLSGVVLDGGPLGVVRTDANGNYCFENIVEGTNYQINVSCNGYMMAKTQVLFGTINHNIEHNLDAIKLSRVTGRIVHDGSPLPSVTLDAGPYGICLTDANGFYHFDNVPENTDLEIRALGAGFMFKRTSTTTDNSQSSAAKARSTPSHDDKNLEDSLAALVGDGKRVA